MGKYLIPVVGAVVVAAVTALLTGYFDRRKTAGTVETSTASDLWAASRELHQRLTEEVIRRAANEDNLRTSLRESLDREQRYIERLAVAEKKIEELERELAQLKAGHREDST